MRSFIIARIVVLSIMLLSTQACICDTPLNLTTTNTNDTKCLCSNFEMCVERESTNLQEGSCMMKSGWIALLVLVSLVFAICGFSTCYIHHTRRNHIRTEPVQPTELTEPAEPEEPRRSTWTQLRSLTWKDFDDYADKHIAPLFYR